VRHTHWLRPKTKIKNLYLTGQDSFSAGFCGSMLSSRLCYSALTGDWWFMLKKVP
jgi:phytoene dehydrogenase-like protein